MLTKGTTYEVLRDTILYTPTGEVQVRRHDLVEYLGSYNARGHYQSDPRPEDHFKLLGGSQDCAIDHPNWGAEGTLSSVNLEPVDA